MSETREMDETRKSTGDVYDASLEWLKNNLVKEYGSLNKAYREMGASKSTLYKALREEAVPRAREYLNWLNQQGVDLVYPEQKEFAKCQPEVNHFHDGVLTAVQAQHMSNSSFKPIPVYRKSDLTQSFGKSEEWKNQVPIDWVLTTDSYQSLPHDCIGVRVPSHDRSMVPTLNPGDVVLIDLVNTWRGHHNDIHLVRCHDGDLVFRRVCIQPQKCSQTGEMVQLVCLQSDNVSEYVPILLNLKDPQFENKLDRAVLGRVARVIHSFP